MTTKVCTNCGWELAVQDPNNFCPICHTRFKIGICNKCGQVVEFYGSDRGVCRECYLASRTPGAMQRVRQRRDAIYNEWLDKIRSIPKSYPTLTEVQWLEAVKFFGRCALCESESVDARGYFVPFKLGGRYCDWNVVPLCEKCAMKVKTNPNYFQSYPRPVGLDKIIEYLEVRLDAAIAKSRK